MGRTAAMKQQSEGIALVMERTEIYAKHRSQLALRVGTLTKQIDALKRKQMGRSSVGSCAAKDSRAELKAAIEANRLEFEKPKTRTFFGIKVGFRKQPGALSYDDAEQVVKLIEKQFPDQAEVLIKTTKTPLKKRSNNSPARISRSSASRLARTRTRWSSRRPAWRCRESRRRAAEGHDSRRGERLINCRRCLRRFAHPSQPRR
jgi:hypothetical protein